CPTGARVTPGGRAGSSRWAARPDAIDCELVRDNAGGRLERDQEACPPIPGRKTMTIRSCVPKLALLWAWALAPIGAAFAQSPAYPTKPVVIISDSAPGSAVDVGLRIVADGLSQLWNQQLVVANHPGAGGAISAKVAADAAPDGYTLYAPALSGFLACAGKGPTLALPHPAGVRSSGPTL